MDNEKQVDPAINESEGELEIVLDDNGAEDVEALKAEIAKKNEALKQVLARAKAAEAKAKEKPVVIEEKKETYGANFDDALELRFQGYSKDAVDFILKNGGLKSLDNPYVKSAVQAMKEQEKAEKSVPSDTSNKSDVEKKYTNEQLQNMSAAELLKILPKSNR
jgi:hypothetical protein